jgi:hypothetical protein
MHGGRGIFCVVASLALGAGVAQEQKAQRPATEKAPPPPAATEPAPEEELLEFLGSVDEEDGDWIDYLTATDLAPTPVSQPAQSTPRVKQHE